MRRGGALDISHPTDGAWRPLDAFVLTGADPTAACPSGFTGFTVRWSTIQASPRRWDRFHDELLRLEAPLRIDVADSSPAQRHRDFTGALAAGPDLICFDSAKKPWDSDSFQRIDAEAAEEEVALVLSASAAGRGAGADRENAETSQRLWALFHTSQSVTALRMEAFDEDLAEALGHHEDAGLFSPGFEFASAFRRGAGAFEGTFGLLGSAAAAEALEMLQTDLGGALTLERKLQRWAEGAFERSTRDLAPAERQRALAEAFAYFEEGRGDPPRCIASSEWAVLLRAARQLDLFPTSP